MFTDFFHCQDKGLLITAGVTQNSSAPFPFSDRFKLCAGMCAEWICKVKMLRTWTNLLGTGKKKKEKGKGEGLFPKLLKVLSSLARIHGKKCNGHEANTSRAPFCCHHLDVEIVEGLCSFRGSAGSRNVHFFYPPSPFSSSSATYLTPSMK